MAPLSVLADGQHAVTLATGYLVSKFVVRFFVGHKVDDRGWGEETYICAFLHQAAVSCMSLRALAAQTRDGAGLEAWLTRGWSPLVADDHHLERLIMLANMTEMWTDCVMYTRYPAFGAEYWAHHIATFLATASFLTFGTAPVGFAVLYAGLMEMGSGFLSLALLVPHPVTYFLRTAMYGLTRLASTAVLIVCTFYTIQGKVGLPLICLTPVWTLMLVNLRWTLDMLVRYWLRQKADPWAVSRNRRTTAAHE